MDKPITLGYTTTSATDVQGPDVVCHDPRLLPHIRTPWFRAYVQRELGTRVAEPTKRPESRAVAVDGPSLARHALICGGTGSGKSRLIEHMVTEQIRRGCSALVLDPKAETMEHLLGHVQAAGVQPAAVTILSPRIKDAVPGWNPFATDIPITQAAGDFVAMLERSTTSWGPRMQDLLTNAIIVVGAHKLSLYELARLLLRDDYREGLLREHPHTDSALAYAEARTYFLEEFGVWGRSEKANAVGPVMNKLREILRSPFLSPLLCARRNTLDLRRLWHQQHIVLVHLDRTALGDEGARLLAGMLTNLLFRTALRVRGPVPVVLAMDELATVEHFVGNGLAEIVTVARSQGLRLLVACQHLAQLSEGLRSALLANACVQAFFRLGHADARLVAASLATGTQARVLRVMAQPEREDRYSGSLPLAEWRHPILDPQGRPLRLSEKVWQSSRPGASFRQDVVSELRGMAVRSKVGRLYVRAADGGAPTELGRYTAGVEPALLAVEGPAPLSLLVRFPRPQLTGAVRTSETQATAEWTRTLQDLPVQHAVLRISGSAPRVTRIVDVPLASRLAGSRAYIAHAVLANGMSAGETLAALRWRVREVERIASGRTGALGEEIDDGSIR